MNGMDNIMVTPPPPPPPLFSILPQNPGMGPVDMVRDPRIGRLWTKYKEMDLPVPKFKVHTLTGAVGTGDFFPGGSRGAVRRCRHTPLTPLWDVQ